MELHDLIERAEYLFTSSGSDDGLVAIEHYSKGEIDSLEGLNRRLRRIELNNPRFAKIVETISGSPDNIEDHHIYRLLHSARSYEAMAGYLVSIRPDLKEEILDSLKEEKDAV